MTFLLALAIAPGAYIVYRVYKIDKVEKEPVPLIKKLLLAGALVVIPVIVAELIASLITDALNASFMMSRSMYVFLEAFLGTALIEEAGKYIVMKKITWRSEHYDYTFDGVVYAVCVGMGFAIIENISYVFANGVGNAIIRAITAVPGHAVYAIYMGYYYGCARICREFAEKEAEKRNLRKSLWVPVIIHGFYDYCLMMESGLLVLVFLVFIIVLFIITIRNIGIYASRDTAITDDVIDVAYTETEDGTP